MIDRFTFALAATAAILAMGWLIRARVNRRAASLASHLMLESANRPRLLVFSTRFCGECVTQRWLIEQAAQTWGDTVEVSFHDAARDRELAGRFGILTVPAIVIADASGRVRDIRQGLTSEDRLRSLVESSA